MMTVQRWFLSHHKDEPFSIQLTEEPLWAMLVEQAIESVDTSFGHRWCNPPEILFKIPVGLPKRDKDGYLDKSVGNAVFSSFQYMTMLSFRRQTLRTSIPISRETAALIDSDTVDEWTDLFNLDPKE